MAEWFTAFGTLALAVVAIFQDTIRGWFFHPTLDAAIQTKPPDCGFGADNRAPRWKYNC
jgi:hypothetical protein